MLKKNLALKFSSLFLQLIYSFYVLKLFYTNVGPELTADWILISSLLSLINLSDFGIVEAFSNRYIMSRGENFLQRQIFATAFYSLIFLFLTAFTLVLIFPYSQHSFFNFKTIADGSVWIVILFLIIIGFVVNTSKLLFVYIKADNNSYIQFTFEAILQFLELVLIVGAIFIEMGLLELVCCLAILRLSYLLIVFLYIKNIYYVDFSYSNFHFQLLKELTKQSLAFLSYPISYALINVFSIMIIVKFYSPREVIMYTSMRTLISGYKSVFGVVNSSIAPILTFNYGNKSLLKFFNLRYQYIFLSVILTTVLIFIFIFYGPLILNFWLVDKTLFNPMLFIGGFFSLYFWVFWYVDSLFLNSFNQNKRFSVYFLLSAVSFILLMFLYGIFKLNFYYIGLLLIIFDLTLGFFTNKEYRRFRILNSQIAY